MNYQREESSPLTRKFKNLKPGERIVIPLEGDDKKTFKVSQALYKFKYRNALPWSTSVRTEGINCVVYRHADDKTNE